MMGHGHFARAIVPPAPPKGRAVTKFLHSMIRVTDPDATLAFFELIGVKEVRRFDSEAGRFTLIYLAAPGQADIAEVELTYNWPAEDGAAETYDGGRNSGTSRSRSRISTRPARRCSMRASRSIARPGTGTWPS
jgi:hypothetical protein